MVVSRLRELLPAGRSAPYMFNRLNGSSLGQFATGSSGGRGTFALLADRSLFAGPADRDGRGCRPVHGGNGPGRSGRGHPRPMNPTWVLQFDPEILTNSTTSVNNR